MFRFKCSGFDKETGLQTDLVVDAPEGWKARRDAERRGVEVRCVEALDPPPLKRAKPIAEGSLLADDVVKDRPFRPWVTWGWAVGTLGVCWFLGQLFEPYDPLRYLGNLLGGIGLLLAFAGVILAAALLLGWIAERRGHHNAEAIHVCGIIGVFIWPAWIVALIWAHTRPASPVNPPVKQALLCLCALGVLAVCPAAASTSGGEGQLIVVGHGVEATDRGTASRSPSTQILHINRETRDADQ